MNLTMGQLGHIGERDLPLIFHEQLPLLDLDAIRDVELREMVLRWQAMCDQDDDIPVWDMTFAMEFPRLAGRCFLYELNGDEVHTKFIGEQSRKYLNLERTSGDLFELIPEVNVRDIHARILKCVKQRLPNYCQKSMSWNDRRDHLDYEAIFLPFRKADDEVCRVVYSPMSFYPHHE
jgi:hypothetical protein